ncbi:MAG: hypothetical protein DHS20C18_41410 [Saprospiraceae bacterium]|nr:MAG: hypothetical protein DHS20C18_41410 [Saprospiraceae bacterium]
MVFILGLLALIFPRLLIIVLWLFTDWFDKVIGNILYLLLGLIFVPVGTLWYGFVMHYMGGAWDALAVVGMVIALAIDFGAFNSSRKYRR